MIRRTRIVCTMGPASTPPVVLRALIRAGMDVARLNFSHGDHAEQERTLLAVKKLAHECGRHVALLQDLQGPKIRIGGLPGGSIRLLRGEKLRVASRNVDSAGAIEINQVELVQALRRHDKILLQDGEIELRVLDSDGEQAHCQVLQGGVLREHQGVTVPERDLQMPSLTAKDLDDLKFGADLGFDYVALSFVTAAADIEACRRALSAVGSTAPIIAKLERVRALRHLDEILAAADGVMVARGDLGVEMSLAELPAAQKNIIDRANRAGKPVITATEMLESMVESSRPTRAEASDVANAIWDGSDAVMLSQETSIGAHPVRVVRAMAQICRAAERHPVYRRLRPGQWAANTVETAIAAAASQVAEQVGARAIVAFTESGATALRVSKAKPLVPILAASPHPEILRRTAIYSGVVPLEVVNGTNTDDMIANATGAARASGLVRSRDRVVLVAGTPVGESGQTNLVRVASIE
ncbi:MAG: pyruvate kinase [Candidatus Dormibacteraceae bacterium]